MQLCMDSEGNLHICWIICQTLNNQSEFKQRVTEHWSLKKKKASTDKQELILGLTECQTKLITCVILSPFARFLCHSVKLTSCSWAVEAGLCVSNHQSCPCCPPQGDGDRLWASCFPLTQTKEPPAPSKWLVFLSQWTGFWVDWPVYYNTLTWVYYGTRRFCNPRISPELWTHFLPEQLASRITLHKSVFCVYWLVLMFLSKALTFSFPVFPLFLCLDTSSLFSRSLCYPPSVSGRFTQCQKASLSTVTHFQRIFYALLHTAMRNRFFQTVKKKDNRLRLNLKKSQGVLGLDVWWICSSGQSQRACWCICSRLEINRLTLKVVT